MKISKVCCQGCGAALEVSEEVRFATCNYCHANLEIVHDSTVTHTRLLEELDRKTTELSDSVRALHLENQLERLDRDWERYRQSSMVYSKNGRPHEPSMAGSVIGGVVAIGMGVVALIMTSSMGAPFPMPLFSLVFIVMGVIGLASGSSRASAFESERERYEVSRRKLEQEIKEAGGGSPRWNG